MTKTKRRPTARPRKAKDERESRSLDFKERFDPGNPGDWCELIKDIIAMANSGGGKIVIGVNDDGQASGWDPSPVLQLDHAQMVDRVGRYVGEPFAEFGVVPGEVNNRPVAVIGINGVPVPMVFVQPGTYDVGGGKQKTAFARGTIYFRHGAKSEPAHPRDLRQVIHREVDRVRKSWMGNIRKIVRAPAGAQVRVLPEEIRESLNPTATAIRVVDDPRAPAYRKIDPNVTHPYRQKELVGRVNELLGGSRRITPHNVQCVRRVHRTESRSDWYYKPKFASPQYSEAFAEWLTAQHATDPQFFDKCRVAYKSKMGP